MKRSKQTFWNRTSLFSILFLICFIILMIPIIMMSVSYYISQNSLREQVMQTQVLTLRRICDVADTSLQEIANHMLALSVDTDTANLSSYSEEASPLRARALAQYQKKVANIERLLPFSSMLMVYFENSDLIVSEEGIIKGAAFTWYAKEKSIEDEVFNRILHGDRYQEMIVANHGKTDSKLVLINRIYNISTKEPVGTVLAVITCSKFLTTIRDNVISSAGTLYLEDDVGILTEGPDEIQKWYKSSIASCCFNFRYSFYALNSDVLAPLYYQRIMLIALLMIAFVMGIILIFYFLRNAMQHTHSLFCILLPEQQVSRRIDLGKLMESAEHIQQEHEQMLLLQNKNERTTLEKHLIISLQKEKLVMEEWFDLLQRAELSKDELYYIALIRFKPTRELRELLITYARNTHGIAVCFEDQCVMLLASGMDPEYSLRNVMDGQIHLRCALSWEARPIIELADAYFAAQRTIDYMDFWSDSICSFSRVSYHQTDENYVETAESMMDASGKIVNAIHVGDYCTCRKLSQDAINNVFGRTLCSLDMDVCLLHALIALIVQALTHHAPQQDVSFINQLQVDKRFLPINTFYEMRREMDLLFDELLYYQNNRQKSLPPYIDRINAEIEKSYADQDFSITKLAETYGCNASYLSHYYKKYTGVGILDRLHQKRICEAKKLLKSGKSVRATAELIGYMDSRSLIRTFKRYMGITPGQYKE